MKSHYILNTLQQLILKKWTNDGDLWERRMLLCHGQKRNGAIWVYYKSVAFGLAFLALKSGDATASDWLWKIENRSNDFRRAWFSRETEVDAKRRAAQWPRRSPAVVDGNARLCELTKNKRRRLLHVIE